MDIHTANPPKSQDIFTVIEFLQDFELNRCLKILLQEKGMDISQLYRALIDRNYYITQKSLYRYFTTNPKSRRFPPEDFIVVFGQSLDLPAQEISQLVYLRNCSRLTRKLEQ